MEELKEAVRKYSNDYLLEQFIDCQEEYTPDALKILKFEIDKRNIGQEEIDNFLKSKETGLDEKKPLDTKDFVSFDHQFSHTDIILAVAILRDSKIIFYVDNDESSETIPIESEAVKRYTIHVHKDYIEKTHELLDEHFAKNDGLYSFKYAGAIERLRSFNFYDLHLSEMEAKETIEVDLTSDEREIVIQYGKRLLDEVDKIEKSQERVVFYYDAIEPLVEYLSDMSNKMMCRSDLLAILEILQIYSQETDFPQSMNDSIATLLSFFLDA